MVPCLLVDLEIPKESRAFQPFFFVLCSEIRSRDCTSPPVLEDGVPPDVAPYLVCILSVLSERRVRKVCFMRPCRKPAGFLRRP